MCLGHIDKSWVIYDNNYRLFLGGAPVITFLTVCPPLIIFVLAGFTLCLLLSHDLYATWELGTNFHVLLQNLVFYLGFEVKIQISPAPPSWDKACSAPTSIGTPPLIIRLVLGNFFRVNFFKYQRLKTIDSMRGGGDKAIST